ncbi:hypothetical protein FRB98_001651 [Tulasnella sp. 332]|nr:hypothetical protein FRB98_001651 [Tulasnella sp. 332]
MHPRPRIQRLARSSVIFAGDNTLSSHHKLLAPFLSPELLRVNPEELPTKVTVTTNTYYIQPLHKDIFALAPFSLPMNALAFVGLAVWIANGPSDDAQGLYIAHLIPNGQVLDDWEQLLDELAESHSTLGRLGFEPEKMGR